MSIGCESATTAEDDTRLACRLQPGHEGRHEQWYAAKRYRWGAAPNLDTETEPYSTGKHGFGPGYRAALEREPSVAGKVDTAQALHAATADHDRRMATVLASVESYRLEAARLIVDSLDRLAGAGVRVFEVGDGPTRVRVELEAGGGPVLIRRAVRDMLRVSAPDHPAAQADEDDPEQADQDSDDQPSADVGAAEPAGDDLDLAHVK